MSSAQALLSQFTGAKFTGDDDPRIQSLIQELLDDFRPVALRVEAAAENRLLEEVERIRWQYCTPSESIDFYYRLLANDPSTVASPTYVVGSRPPQTLELTFYPPVAAAPVEAEASATAAQETDPHPGATLPDPPLASSANDGSDASAAPLQRSQSLQKNLSYCVDVQGTLEMVCQHLGLRYDQSDEDVKLVLDGLDGEVKFSPVNLPCRRLLEDSRMNHPVYVKGLVKQRHQECIYVTCDGEEPPDPITNIPIVLVDILVLPLLMKADSHRDRVNKDYANFQSTLKAVTGAMWGPFQSLISFDQWLPRRLLCKLCRRAGCPMESNSALTELRTEFRKFLEALLTVVHELQKHKQVSIITCDTLLRAVPRLYEGNRPDLRVFGYGVVGNIRHVLGSQMVLVQIQVHPFLILDEVTMSIVHDLIVTTMLDVARLAKSQSLQRGHLHVTLWCRGSGATEASQRRPWEYALYEVHAEGREDDVMVVTMDEVLAAIRVMLPQKITENVLNECSRALSRYKQHKTTNDVPFPGTSLRLWASLTFAPEMIALLVDTFFGVGDVCLTIEALIALTAMTEYLAAELLALSGDAAKNEQSDIITPYHLSMAILGDEELLALYPGKIRYGCHVLPALHAFTVVNADDTNTTWMRTVDEYLASVVATEAAVPHLLCGRYVGPSDGNVPETEPQYTLMPVLDCLAYPTLGEAKRQLMAIEAAPVEVQQAVVQMGADPASTWHRRLLELKREQMQCPMFPLFTHETMFALSSLIMQDIGPTAFTTEAVDLLATLSESFMVKFVKDAFLLATEAGRWVLEPIDIQMAHRLRDERS